MILKYIRFFAPLSVVLLLVGYVSSAAAACDGPYGMLALINRPTIADSACTVHLGEVLIEAGYENVKKAVEGVRQNFYPIAQLRTGLPKDGEVSIILPYYVDNPRFPFSGLASTAITLKKEIYTNPQTVFSLDGAFTIPSGSKYYGEQAPSGKFSGVFAYAITDYFAVSGMFSAMYQGQPAIERNKQFASFNPDIVTSLNITPRLVLYGEVYGQTKVSADLGSGYNANEGFIFLLKENITLDIEISQRLYGYLDSFDSYIAAGISIKLG